MSAVASAVAAAGWQARLELRFEATERRTRLAHRSHRGPLQVQRAFYPEPRAAGASQSAEPCHLYVIHPPGGVVSGDTLQIEVDVETQAHALLTTPAAGKFYRGVDQRLARLSQTLRVNGGVLEWLPQENIFYPDAAVELRTVVHLAGSARFIGWEIGCLGLPANHLSLAGGAVRQAFELWHDGAPVLLERVLIGHECLSARWGLAGRAAIGTWLAFPADMRLLDLARANLAAINCGDTALACTLIDGLLCCRGYAARADLLKQVYIDLWGVLRPELLAREANPPRVWAT